MCSADETCPVGVGEQAQGPQSQGKGIGGWVDPEAQEAAQGSEDGSRRGDRATRRGAWARCRGAQKGGPGPGSAG